MTPYTVEFPFIQFNGKSGYTRHGDTVSLFAEWHLLRWSLGTCPCRESGTVGYGGLSDGSEHPVSNCPYSRDSINGV
jgi:hypothetical protein